MYYEAEIYLSVELMTQNKKGEWELGGTDYHDHGLVETLTAPTVSKLIEKIEKRYFSLIKPIGADVQIYDGALEISYEGEHDYRTPKKEQTPFIETVRIVISKVEKEILDLAKLKEFKGVAR